MSDYETNLARIKARSEARIAKMIEEGVSDTPETTQLEDCDFHKLDDEHAEIKAYNRMLEHAKTLERERNDILSRLTAIEHRMPEELARLERERDEAMRWQKEGQP
jgi:chromosome segregation ATPase